MNISPYEATVNDGARSDDQEPAKIYSNNACLGVADAAAARRASDRENDAGVVVGASSNDAQTDPRRTTSEGPHLLGSPTGEYQDDTDRKPPAGIENPGPADVLLGRGATTNRHPGNKRYRKLVGVREAEYNCYFATEDDKARIVDYVIDGVRSSSSSSSLGASPGRFLARLTDAEAKAVGITSPKDPRFKLWYEVLEDKRVRDKVKQSFRTNSARQEREEGLARRAASLQQSVTYVDTPNTASDFLMGRGVHANEANVQLRGLVQRRQDEYMGAKRAARKNKIISEVVAEWRGKTLSGQRFLIRVSDGSGRWSEASASQIHQAVQKMFLRPKLEPKALATVCRTPSRGAVSTVEDGRALVTPSPFKEALPSGPADVARPHSFASDYHASTSSHEASIELPFQSKKRGKATNSGRKLHKHNAKKVKSQGELKLRPHDLKLDTLFPGHNVFKECELVRSEERPCRDSHLTEPSSSGMDEHDIVIQRGADMGRRANLTGNGDAQDTITVEKDERQVVCEEALPTAPVIFGIRAFFVQEQSLTAHTANALLPSQARRQWSADLMANAARSSQSMSRSPGENYRRPSPPRYLSLNNSHQAGIQNVQDDTQLPHDMLTDDQFLDCILEEMLADRRSGTGPSSEEEESSTNKTHSRHCSSVCSISNPGLVLHDHAMSANVGPQEFNDIENRPPGMAREPLGRESNSSVVTNANLSSNAPSTQGRDDESYTPCEFFRLSPGDRSSASDMSESLRRLGCD